MFIQMVYHGIRLSPGAENTMPMTRSYPPVVEIYGAEYGYELILKDDFFSVNVLYRNQKGERYVLKLSDFRFVLGWLFRPLTGWPLRTRGPEQANRS